jgi:RimJ/RimL family protein N-acetyltransferase
MISSCSAYRIEKEGVVIGPINAAPQWRGRGIAPDALRMAMNALLERGLGIFYIDTSHTHAASQRAIAKCDFGDPVSVHIIGQATGK